MSTIFSIVVCMGSCGKFKLADNSLFVAGLTCDVNGNGSSRRILTADDDDNCIIDVVSCDGQVT